jgi:hypothetical protein
MYDDATMRALQTRLRGELLHLDEAGSETARTVSHSKMGQPPRLMVRCANVADVIAAVKFAGQHQCPVTVQGGGQHGGGLRTGDDALVIDLSRMQGIRVDPVARTVWVEGGCTWGDVDHATHAFGLATPGGMIATTGMGGITLGGGVGYLTRAYGLPLDNLLAVDMVLADGRFVTASAEEHEALFWAVRGGGSTVGIVTAFLLQLHPLRTVYGGPMLWPLDRTTAVMQGYRDVMAQAPDDLTGVFAFLQVPPGPPFPPPLQHQPMCGVLWCSTSPCPQAAVIAHLLRACGQLQRVEALPDLVFEPPVDLPFHYDQQIIIGIHPGVAARTGAIEDDLCVGDHRPHCLAALRQEDTFLGTATAPLSKGSHHMHLPGFPVEGSTCSSGSRIQGGKSRRPHDTCNNARSTSWGKATKIK